MKIDIKNPLTGEVWPMTEEELARFIRQFFPFLPADMSRQVFDFPAPKGIMGVVTLDLFDAQSNELVSHARYVNLIHDQGKGYFQQNYQNDSPVNPGYLVVSSSQAAPAAGDTSVPATVLGGNAVTKSRPNNTTCRWFCMYDTGEANGDIWRVAICSAANGTGLFSSVKLGAATTKTNQQQLNCTYDHVFTWA